MRGRYRKFESVKTHSRIRKKEGIRMVEKHVTLDGTDWAILGQLQENARASFTAIGGHVGLTSPAVRERIRKMEDSGIIRGYRVVLDQASMGNPIGAIVGLKSKHEWPEQHVPVLLDQIPEVLRYWGVTGSADFFIELAVPSVEKLEGLLQQISGLGFVSTYIVLYFSENDCPMRPLRNQ